MPPIDLPPAALAGLRVVKLAPRDAPLLQRFFDANPRYFETVQDEPAWPDAAKRELRERVPAHMPHGRHWIVGWRDEHGKLAAVANIVSDLVAVGVWHLGLFIVDATRHGRGDAQAIYAGIEAWARAGGAQWLRLGVVEGNDRAERFWTRQGYVQVRLREGMPMGHATKTVRVKLKPLGGGTVDAYLALVERDRPESLAP